MGFPHTRTFVPGERAFCIRIKALHSPISPRLPFHTCTERLPVRRATETSSEQRCFRKTYDLHGNLACKSIPLLLRHQLINWVRSSNRGEFQRFPRTSMLHRFFRARQRSPFRSFFSALLAVNVQSDLGSALAAKGDWSAALPLSSQGRVESGCGDARGRTEDPRKVGRRIVVCEAAPNKQTHSDSCEQKRHLNPVCWI